MKRFAAQYIVTYSGPLLKRGVVTVEDNGTIVSVTDNAGVLTEEHSTEFHNGIIIPGTKITILEELKTLQLTLPEIPLQDLILRAGLNFQAAQGDTEQLIEIIAGTKPGLLLIQDLDLQKMKLLPESYITRLI
jgi:hypothetical protein